MRSVSGDLCDLASLSALLQEALSVGHIVIALGPWDQPSSSRASLQLFLHHPGHTPALEPLLQTPSLMAASSLLPCPNSFHLLAPH